MANENTILTALGLDISQFEKGASGAVSAIRPLITTIDAIDSGLRKIPIIGGLYSASLGKIAEGFAETRLQARSFAQTMQTDVSGSLDGSIKQVEEINDQLKELKQGSFAQSISDNLSNSFQIIGIGADSAKKKIEDVANQSSAAGKTIQNSALGRAGGALKNFFGWSIGEQKKLAQSVGVGLTSTGFSSEQEKRAQMIAKLEERKTQNVQNTISLLQKESAAHSAIVSGSELESEQSRAYLEMRQRILGVIQQAQKIGGPDSAKWNAEIQKSVGEQANLYIEIYNKQVAASKSRNDSQMEELKTAAKLADLQANSNEREIAAEEEKLALKKQANAEATGVKEEIAAAQSASAIARAHSEQAQKQYELSVAQLSIETRLQFAQVTGQTRAAKQLEIQARYQVRINEEMRRGNTELARQYSAQQKIAKLEEAIRQYELGGRGRASERRSERIKAREARVVQSRLDRRERSDSPMSGLRSGGLVSGNLARSVKSPIKEKTIPVSRVEQFFRNIEDALTK